MELVLDILVGDKEFHMKRFAKCVAQINEIIIIELAEFEYMREHFLSEHGVYIEFCGISPMDVSGPWITN
jgi:hypothetical protein